MIEAIFTRFKNACPVRWIGEVSETSAAITFLADGNMASFLTGILLRVDGGLLTVRI